MKNKIKKIFRMIKIYKNDIRFYSIISIFIAVEVTIVLLLYFLDYLIIRKEMLYWLFSATSQSMAALFAVVGFFAVFRYERLDNKLKNLYDSLKKKFQTHDWIYHFGATGSEAWEDSIVITEVKNRLNQRKERLPNTIKQDLTVSIIMIGAYETARDKVISGVKISLVSVLIAFLLPISLLPFAELISQNIFGLISILTILSTISFSVINIFSYLMKSMSPIEAKKKKKKKKQKTAANDST